MIFRLKLVTQNPRKSHLCPTKYRGLYDGEQDILVIFRKLFIMQTSVSRRNFEIIICFGKKNDFSVKIDDPKSGKIALLHYKISRALRRRATRLGDFESTSVYKQVYRGGFLNS